jgi:hypothetical protein
MIEKQKIKLHLKKIILILSLTFMSSLLLISCRAASGDPIDVETFIRVMEAEGYVIRDSIEEIKEIDDFFEDTLQYALMAVGEEYHYDFFVFLENSYARMKFLTTKSNLRNIQGNVVTRHSERNTLNYYMYSFISEGTYYHLVRVHNVVIFASADSEHRSAIREVLGNF